METKKQKTWTLADFTELDVREKLEDIKGNSILKKEGLEKKSQEESPTWGQETTDETVEEPMTQEWGLY